MWIKDASCLGMTKQERRNYLFSAVVCALTNNHKKTGAENLQPLQLKNILITNLLHQKFPGHCFCTQNFDGYKINAGSKLR